MAQMGRPRQSDRDTALASAMHLFWENGYEATSLSQLKAVLGLSAPSFLCGVRFERSVVPGGSGPVFAASRHRHRMPAGHATGAMRGPGIGAAPLGAHAV